MLTFFKTLLQSLYRSTVGGLVRFVQHTWERKLDKEDKQFFGRVLIYSAFGIFTWCFPTAGMTLLGLRILLIKDIADILVNCYFDAVNSLRETLEPAT